jgi:hypothetical protein
MKVQKSKNISMGSFEKINYMLILLGLKIFVKFF